jgi:hypothetical protein
MSDQSNDEKHVNQPKYLSMPWFVALVAGLCVVPAVAGAVAEEMGGNGWILWLAVWGVMATVSAAITYQYANPNLPILCGVMVGITAPRPSGEWLRQFTAEKWLKAAEIGMSMVVVVIGLMIFSAIAKRHQRAA